MSSPLRKFNSIFQKDCLGSRAGVIESGIWPRAICSPNSACTMGFWRVQGPVKAWHPAPVFGHAKSSTNRQFLRLFKNNGAGARGLNSTAAVFEECLSKFASFGCETWCDPTTRPPASLGVQGSSKGCSRGPKRLPKESQGSKRLTRKNENNTRVGFGRTEVSIPPV